MEEDNVIDFNFWPSFADLMLAIVLILVLVLFLVNAVISVGVVNLRDVRKNQKTLVETIASSYGVKSHEMEANTVGISTEGSGNYDIMIRSEATLQRITFSDKILFNPDDYKLNAKGEGALRKVGEALKGQLAFIREIQIQGHADTDRSGRFGSNIELAAQRAIKVFEFFQKEIEIDPAKHLMSVTSFGEFKPIKRTGNERQYDQRMLLEHNRTPELKGDNRRIELLLFYHLQDARRSASALGR